MLLVVIIVDPTAWVYSFEAPADARRLSALRLQQQIQCRASGFVQSRFFYWDDLPSRRVWSDIFTREQALELATAFARAARDKDGL